MPNTRVMLWVALAAILFLNYEAWMRDYPPVPVSPVPAQSINGAAPNQLRDSVPTGAGATTPGSSSITSGNPAQPAPGAAPPALNAAPDSAAPDAAAIHSNEPPLHIVTDVLDVAINLRGGEVDRADLLQYPLHKDTPNIPVRLMNDTGDDSLYLLQTGLMGTAGEAAPTHNAIWSSRDKSYTLAAGADELRVPLTWTDGHGLTVTKTFTFHRGSYAVGLTYEVQNDGAEARGLASYSQF
jgi:YidC/Oxa1 family membrane protein insertase